MSVFIIFILSMGAKMLLSNENDDLVENDYYEKGLSYSAEYDRTVNAVQDDVIPTIEVREKGLSITFAGSSRYVIKCTYVSDSKYDRTFKGETIGDNSVVISEDHLRAGSWRVNIEFTSNGKDYQFKQEINIQ